MAEHRTGIPRYLGWLLAGLGLWLAFGRQRARPDAALRRQAIQPIGSYRRPG